MANTNKHQDAILLDNCEIPSKQSRYETPALALKSAYTDYFLFSKELNHLA
jgi:hypothetical protein